MKQITSQPTRQIRKIIFVFLLSAVIAGNAGKVAGCRTEEITITQTEAS